MAAYSKQYAVIHGTRSDAINQKHYTEAYGGAYSLHTGIPPMCMALQLDNFHLSNDRRVMFDVTEAALRALNPSGSTTTSSFKYQLDAYVSMLVSNVSSYSDYSEMVWRNSTLLEGATRVFSKPYNVSTWGDKVYKLSSPVTLQSTPVTSDKRLYIVISIVTTCCCPISSHQEEPSGNNSVSFIDDITNLIPKNPDPYLWRMQYSKDPSVTSGTQGWHLVRPYYICTTINGVKGWCSCEDPTHLIYDSNGNKL